jgi:hypothetical protein
MTCAGTSARKGWTNHIQSQRIRQAPVLGLDSDTLAYFLASDDLRKDRPYFTERPDTVAARVGFGHGPNARRKLQRFEARLESEGKIHRVLVRGRRDLVSGRETVTGRIGIIPLVTLSELPIAAGDMEIAALEGWMRDQARKRAKTLKFSAPNPPLVARQPCRATSPGCTTNLSPLSPPTEGLERVTETTTYEPEPGPSLSSLDECKQETEESLIVKTPAATIAAEKAPGLAQDGAELDQAPLTLAALMNVLVRWVIALRLGLSKANPAPLARAMAESLILGAAKFYRGGLRWVAWAIHGAAHRQGPDRGPAKFWSFVVGTLRNWQKGDGAPPDGWPPLPAKPTAAPVPKPTPREEPPDPPDRAELERRIAELSAKRRLTNEERCYLMADRAKLAALDKAGEEPEGRAGR